MRVEDLEIPVPVIDLDRVEHNLAKLQAYCDSHDLRLRPHIKTHRTRAFARRQVELGACGITCQKLGEAGITISVVSGGGTPNAWHAHEVVGLTEVRVSTYIYHDRATVRAEAASTAGVRAPAPRNLREPTDRGPSVDRCRHEEPHERSRRTFGRAGIWADPGLSGRRDRTPEQRGRRGGSFPLRGEAGAWGACQDRAESCVRREQFARRGRDEPRRPGGRYVAHDRAGKDTVVLRLILLVRTSMCELGLSLGRARTIDPRIIMRSKLRSGRPGE